MVLDSSAEVIMYLKYKLFDLLFGITVFKTGGFLSISLNVFMVPCNCLEDLTDR